MTIAEIILNNGDPMDWTPSEDIMPDMMIFDPEIGSGAAIAEAFFDMADDAADNGDDESADEYWALGAKAAHPIS